VDRENSIHIIADGATILAPVTLQGPILRVGDSSGLVRNVHVVGGAWALRYLQLE
jgi:hypothetical protein